MSAQGGISNFDGRPVDPDLLARITDGIYRNGPDAIANYTSGSVGMIYRAFHTTAEARRENQPYLTQRGFVMTWDGRLDNREELIELIGKRISTETTDVAIVAEAFDRWETGCFRGFVGDWAISIWKPMEREIVLASDYMCIRHIFYRLKADCMWWSTELDPLVLLSGDRFHIDDEYIAGYFANDPDAHLTPYREIHQVPPGQFVTIRQGKANIQRYWQFTPKSRVRYRSDAEYEEHFRHVFRNSVRRRLRSDSPILAELSGGLDSSSIVCMADDITSKEGGQFPRVDTLSYYDKTEPSGDDWLYFRKVEENRGRVGSHIDAGILSQSASLQYARFSALPGYLGFSRDLDTQRAAVVERGGYRVVLSGIGGDEFMGAIPIPNAQLADLIVQLKLVSLAKQLMAWSLIKRRPWIQLLWQALADLLPSCVGKYVIPQAKVEPWIERDFAKRTNIAVRQLDVDEHFRFLLPTRRSYVGGVLMMSNKLAKSMPATLAFEETRYPYLDRNLIEFMLSIPADQLQRPGERRSLMRRSLAGIVPQDILSRRTKQFGARTPVLAMQTNWHECQILLDSGLSSELGYINPRRFLDALHAAMNGREIHVGRMFKTVSLELWLRDLVCRNLLAVETSSQRFVCGAFGRTQTCGHAGPKHFPNSC